jgi:ATP-dependent DNA helicase RecG
MCRVFVSDDRGDRMELIYFNNKYAPAALQVGKEYVFYGTVQGDLLRRQMSNPVTVNAGEMEGLTPQYPLTEGLTSRMIAANVRQALSDSRCVIGEFLPASVLEEQKLESRDKAVRDIHLPHTYEEASAARKRLVFEELFLLSLGIKLRKTERDRSTRKTFGYTDAAPFEMSLPFELTGAQKRCVSEIAADLGSGRAMSRLLQGDVGSGKTAVAAAAVYLAAANGYQSAVMAPTEVLAEQHAETFRRLLEPFGITVGLLTGSVKGKARTELLKQIGNGTARLVVGTHALISEGVKYRDLGLVVADEQHRFGVAQRAALAEKGEAPHVLVMSATPIPRTLSLIIYGDLDISVLDEMPKGRKPVKTLLVDNSYRARDLGFVRRQVEEGNQAYIVCPLVEQSDALENTLSASEYFEQLQEGPLKGIPMALLHGKMAPADKNAAMDAFTSGKVKVLVSTTVIEVGVDCPSATLMVIENAERFGLSTLHQLRGRVGRGDKQSWCVLVSSADSGTAGERLKLLCDTDDGFEIARYDLKMRGPGDFIGNRQHGLPALDVADLSDDEDAIYAAAAAADRVIAADPALSEHPVLKQMVAEMFEEKNATFN